MLWMEHTRAGGAAEAATAAGIQIPAGNGVPVTRDDHVLAIGAHRLAPLSIDDIAGVYVSQAIAHCDLTRAANRRKRSW